MDDVLLEQTASPYQQNGGPKLMYGSQEKRREQQTKKAAAMQEKLLSLFTGRRRPKGGDSVSGRRESGSGSLTPADSWVEQQDLNLAPLAPSKMYLLNQICQQELQNLAQHCPKGVYTMPSERDERIWYGAIFVAEGPYTNAVFRFTMTLPDDYPDDMPSLHFNSYVWHPQVDPENGSMTAFLARHFPAWDRRQHRLSDVMRVVAMAFCNVDTANAANNEAAEMCMADAKLFEYRVADCIQQAQAETLQNEEGSSVIFRPYNPGTHDRIWDKMLRQEYDGFGGDLIDAGVKMVSNFASALFKNDDKDSA